MVSQDIPLSQTDLLQYFTQHWREEVTIVFGAPIAFGVTVAICVLIAWFIFRFFHKRELERIPILQTELSTRDAENARLKDRLTEKDGEVAKLESKVKELLVEKGTPSVTTPLPVPLKAQRLHFEFPDALIDRSNPNQTIAMVRVKNPTASTIIGVSVRIESIIEITETGQLDTTRSYIYRNLPLPLRDDRGSPPLQEIDLHLGADAVFNLVTLQPHGTETLLHHAVGYADHTGYWLQRPHGALNPGRYRVQLKAQGRDVPAETLLIEFKNVSGEMWIRPGEEPSSLL